MFKGISFESESEPIDKFRDKRCRMLDEELIRQGKVLRDLCDKGELGSEVDEYSEGQ